MSYILDALKKAEQERGSAQLQTVASGRSDRERYRRRWWPAVVALGAVVAGIICLLWLYQGWKKETATTPGQPETRTDVVSRSALMPSAEVPKISQPPTSVVPGSTVPESPKESVAANPIETGNNRHAPGQAQAVPNRNEAAKPIDAGTQPPSVAEKSEPEQVSWRESAAKLRVTMLMYSEDSSERMVFINSRKYKEGEYVEERYLLEKITLEGVQLSYKGDRVFLRP